MSARFSLTAGTLEVPWRSMGVGRATSDDGSDEWRCFGSRADGKPAAKGHAARRHRLKAQTPQRKAPAWPGALGLFRIPRRLPVRACKAGPWYFSFLGQVRGKLQRSVRGIFRARAVRIETIGSEPHPTVPTRELSSFCFIDVTVAPARVQSEDGLTWNGVQTCIVQCRTQIAGYGHV